MINPEQISIINGNFFIWNKVTHDIEYSFCKNRSFYNCTLIYGRFITVKTFNALWNHTNICMIIAKYIFYMREEKNIFKLKFSINYLAIRMKWRMNSRNSD